MGLFFIMIEKQSYFFFLNNEIFLGNRGALKFWYFLFFDNFLINFN